MTTFDQLVEIANAMGCTVKFNKQIRNYFGQYDKNTNSIILSEHNLKTRQDKLITLSHEIGHAYYKHSISNSIIIAHCRDTVSSYQRYRLLKQEKDAWEYAIVLARWFGFYSKKFKREMEKSIACSREEFRRW